MATRVVRLVCYLLFRLLLPTVLLAAAVVRFNALSFVYAIFLLILPLLASPTAQSVRGGTGIYLRVVFIFGLLGILAHSVFHIVLASIATGSEPYGYPFPNCSSHEKIARQIAVERLDGVPAVDIVRLILPDVVVFIAGLLVYIICYKLLKPEPQEQQLEELPTTVTIKRSTRRRNAVFAFIGEFSVAFLLAVSGIIVPSVLSSLYFISFIFIATLWSFYGRLGLKFSFYRIFLLAYSAGHILILHLYQFQFFQESLPPTDFIARLLGLTGIVKTSCEQPWQINFHDVSQWPYFVNPAILLLLYWVVATEVRCWGTRKELVPDETDTADPVKEPRRKKKRRRIGEREVLKPQDKSQTEHLVEAEVTDYSSIDPSRGERSGSPTMLVSGGESEDELDSTKPQQKKSDLKRSAFASVLVYIMRQSYVLSLIAMMAWSITFHSWLTFVLLLFACIVWMIPQSRRACLVTSPIVLLYGICLLIIQFVYGINLNESELPEEKSGVRLSEIGLKKWTYPCLALGLQVVYVLMFWLTVRQFMRERRNSMLSEGEKYQLEPVGSGSRPQSPVSLPSLFNFNSSFDVVDGYDSNTMMGVGQYLWVVLCKYWIFVCAGMLLLISLQEVVIYRIIYMILFLMFIMTFQTLNRFLNHLFRSEGDMLVYYLSYFIWRLTMLLFWWVVIIYSMAVLIMLYTYQFEDFPEYWHNNTGLSMETLADIGLENFDTAGLFIRLLTPTSFLIFVIIQVHYFHTPFLAISDLDRYKRESPVDVDMNVGDTVDTDGGTTTDTETEGGRKKKSFCKRCAEILRKWWSIAACLWAKVARFLWRLMEVHMLKAVAFTIAMVAVWEVSAIGAVYMILLAVFLPMTGCHFVLSHLTQFWTALVLIAKMIYQLRLVDKSNWHSNCTTDNATTLAWPLNTTIDNAVWAGLVKTDDIAYYLKNYIAVLLVIALERIVVYHQQQYFNRPDVQKPKQGIIFSETTREHADGGVKEAVKYFFNYFFYKFGLDMCYVMTAITICVRVDAFSVIYAIFLGIQLLLSRRGSAIFWPIYLIILVVLLLVQYLSSLGLPLGLCFVYPWDDNSAFGRDLENWLYLPDYIHPPNAKKLIADFFQLLFVCLQCRVFLSERTSAQDEHDGGDNCDILPEVEAKAKIPVSDFTSKIASYLDVIKNFVFMYMFWVTLAIVFLAGVSRINLFSMGYVIAVFWFMWFGQDLLIKPLRQLLRMWNFLIGYCFLVMLLKAALQLLGCAYMEKSQIQTKACWLVQLLGLTCLDPSHTYVVNNTCYVEEDNSGLTWDVVCFAFLLLQRRIYASHYFRHIVAALEAQNRLASRGAELINRILVREVAKQKEEENQILEKIKEKMKVLKEKQSKLKKNFIEPEEHYQAIRGGDYYLFEESEGEDEEEEKGPDAITFGQDKDKEGEMEGPSPLQLITTAVTSGTDEALKKSQSLDEGDDEASGEKRDKSADKPASPTKPEQEDITGEGEDGKEQKEEEEETKGGVTSKLTKFCNFIGALLASCADWLISLFNRISRNYRLVASRLKDEYQRVKYEIQSEQRVFGEQAVELQDTQSTEKAAAEGDDSALVGITVEPVQPPAHVPSIKSLSELDMEKFDEDEAKFEESQPRVYRLLVATYYLLVSRSELVCYLLMIVNHIVSASLLSLPLPMMVFLWGMLSVPRPAKTFWITAITYTEAIVIVKYLCQFDFLPWNEKTLVEDEPFWPPRIIGVEKKAHFATMDLVLLLALFIHRTIVKSFGLWKDADDITAEMDQAEKKELSPPSSPTEIEDGSIEMSTKAAESDAADADSLSTQLEEGKTAKKKKKASALKQLVRPFTDFYKQLTCPDYNATTDVYAPMFACDFFNFLVLVFGYSYFGPSATGGGDVTSYIKENRVPAPFLIMLIVQFIFIVVDRALYLRKNVLGKFIFQIFLVILIHIWMFFILPAVTARKFIDNTPAKVYYLVKCLYFGLSAYQIRSAYPTRILGNFLTKKYNYVNLFLFKGFLAIPFLLELRIMMDWIWTDTTMAIGSWLQMEDIYANIYILKCWRHIELTHPTPRSQPKRLLIKYGVGGLLLFLIIFIIWFPLVIFSLANTVYVANPPIECTTSITIGGYQPIFKVTAKGQSTEIQAISEQNYNTLKTKYERNLDVLGFLSGYKPEDITKITLNGQSTSTWGISPPSQEDLIKQLNDSTSSISVEVYMTFTRAPKSGETGESLIFQTYRALTTEKAALAEMISGSASGPVAIKGLFPENLRLPSKGMVEKITLLSEELDVSVALSKSNVSAGEPPAEWWSINETSPDRSDNLILYTFNERASPDTLSFITGYGIIGLYVSLVLVVGRFVRIFFSGQSYRVMYEELPNVDKILHLCLNIYMVREVKNYYLEEELFSKLLFLYRSPETLIKWTKHKLKRD